MTENMAWRGEGLAGLREIHSRLNAFVHWLDLQTRSTSDVRWGAVADKLAPIVNDLETALEAAARLPAAPICDYISVFDNSQKCTRKKGHDGLHSLSPIAAALATPSPQAPPATEFGPFTLTVGELLADGIFHRCVESGEFNHALCAKMIDNALAEEKLSNIAATQEPAGSGADIGKVGASIDFRFAGSGAICAQCKANADWNDGAGYHELAEKCRQYFRDGHPCPSKSGSPRKVGEDGVGRHCEITGTSAYDCYSTQCPDCPYPELKLSREEAINAICLQAAEIVALKAALARSSSVPVGEQKQEEGV